MASTFYSDFLRPRAADKSWSAVDRDDDARDDLDLLEYKASTIEPVPLTATDTDLPPKQPSHRGRRCTSSTRGQCYVFATFFGLIILGLMLFFVIPRIPSIDWPDKPSASFTSSNQTALYTTVPARFDFSAQLKLEADAKSSWIPTRLTSVEVEAFLQSGASIGSGKLDNSVGLPARGQRNITVPVHFSANYFNSSDPTFMTVTTACANSGRLSLSFALRYKVQGRIGTSMTSLQAPNVACPVRLVSDN
ncbi:hypothetical protein ACM66B_005511 [Microbotryomycetes sp. NB124-2]